MNVVQLKAPKSRRPWCDVVAELEAEHLAQRGPRWHLVHVSAYERDSHAVEWLWRHHYEPYYPVIRAMRRVPKSRLSIRQRGRVVMRQALTPMFPRYVMTRFDPDRGRWHEIFDVAGVTGIVCEGGRPVPIADELVERLRAAEVDGAIPADTPARDVFRLGQLVEVTHGPFAMLRGKIEKIRGATVEGLDSVTRVTITIAIFGRLTPALLDASQVVSVGS